MIIITIYMMYGGMYQVTSHISFRIIMLIKFNSAIIVINYK